MKQLTLLLTCLCSALIEADPQSLSFSESQAAQTPDSSQPGVHLRVLDKVTSQKIDLKMRVNQPTSCRSLTLVARSCFEHPPELPHEASTYVEIYDQKSKATAAPPSRLTQSVSVEASEGVYANWMFASAPSINPFEHPEYHVTVVTCLSEAALLAANKSPQDS